MALVDYSDSESDSEAVAQHPPKATPATASGTGKKPIQKVIDRSNPRKILVNLSGTSGQDAAKPTPSNDEPPTKRAKTGGSAFGGFASLLPPPKNAGKPALSSSTGKSAPRPGVNLKTGATPGFSRNTGDDEAGWDGESSNNQPSIPEGQKPAHEVKLVGKPLMFKPLSVSRKPGKKNVTKTAGASKITAASAPPSAPVVSAPEAQPKVELPKKKVSLFSISDEPSEVASSAPSNGDYEPMFVEDTGGPENFAAYDSQYSASYATPSASTTNNSSSLDDIATDMNLSATARRELFGRRGAPAPSQSATAVINFNTDQEYAHNEELRAAGEQQIHNPVRAIAPGKHSLRQLVNQVSNQKEALEESFAKGKNTRNESASRYGWR
jgi:hypothetical protein